MEMIIKNVSYKDIKELTLTISSNKLISIDGKYKNQIISLLVDNKSLTRNKVNLSDNRKPITKHVTVTNTSFYTDKLSEELLILSKKYNKKESDMIDVLKELLHIINMGNLLQRSLLTLSKKEQELMSFILQLLDNYDVVILDNIYNRFDNNYRRKIKTIINYLKENGKIVIIVNESADIIFDIAEYSLIIDKEIIKGSTYDVYTNIPILLDKKIEVPNLSLITYKAKQEKNIKLFYSKDVRDIIKDIYKHV